jgi:hypothetical protein
VGTKLTIFVITNRGIMNKLVIMALGLFIIGTQVCVGAEKEKKTGLTIDVGNQEPTMVEISYKASRKAHATPHHTSAHFFHDSRTAQVARDMLPGIKPKVAAQKQKKSGAKLKLAGAIVVHRPQESISDTVPAADQQQKDSLTSLLEDLAIVDEEVAKTVAGETSPTKIARQARAHAGSVALLAAHGGVTEETSRDKAADLLKDLEACHQAHVQRSATYTQ